MPTAGTVRFTDDIEYPITSAALVDAYGNRSIDLPNGTETVGEVLDRVAPETFETAEEVELTLQSALSRKAIGRYGYSDRDPTPPGSPYSPATLSF
ncbi:DUF5789 family protein [Halovivax limisalsi]|uniref:DUF5789 family protein n=1 Tax=Halovivax limisalsi TaxID=1453760 RepID=UPI001FFDBC51|nr:DUF2795 domain-containing protein [Halovivax limisalsi]